jgi:hypothetical protein
MNRMAAKLARLVVGGGLTLKAWWTGHMGIAAHRTALFAAIGIALGAGPALAQNENKELIAEVIRKANAGEPEGGFCDTTPWPVYRSPQQAARMYDRDGVGSARVSVHRYKSSGCGFARTTAVTNSGGRRCVTETGWHCIVGATCGHYPSYTLCKDADGAYIQE